MYRGIKPIYSLSASLLNKLKWYTIAQTPDAFSQLEKAVKKDYPPNAFTKRGLSFEDSVFAGEHSALSNVVKDTYQQKWYSREIEFEDYIIRISGKMDSVTKDETAIYDIKRIGTYYDDKFSDSYTIQHNLYLFLNPKALNFYYLIAYDSFDKDKNPILEYTAVAKPRPTNLEQLIRSEITQFLSFLELNNLLDTYKQFYTYTPKQ